MSEVQAIPLRGKGPSYSIFKEIWYAFKAHLKLLLVAAVVFGAINGVGHYISPLKGLPIETIKMCEQQNNRDACYQENIEKIQAELKGAIKYMIDNIIHISAVLLLVMLLFVGAYYNLMIVYLKKTHEQAPEKSLSGFWRFICLISWKYTRPVLWNLIPILGQIMYIRSVLRYEVVGYLTVMGHDKPLEESWSLTKGNVWRIFGTHFSASTLLGIVVFITFFPFFLALYKLVPSLMDYNLEVISQGVGLGLGYMLSIFASFATFSVLIKERET